MGFQENITKYLNDNGIKSSVVSEKSGISEPRISNLKHNNGQMNVNELSKFCIALGKTPNDFWDYSQN